MRASALAESYGVPSASICLTAFLEQATATAEGQGIPDLPLAEYPGILHLHSDNEIRDNVKGALLSNVVTALTDPIEAGEGLTEPGPRDIVYRGDLAAVQEFFHENQWTDGLPIIPPTIDGVGQFLRYTDRSPEEVIGMLLPSQRAATVWNVAVNGVMAGCRPEYMPVLLAIAEVIADPLFGLKHLGHTPGSEPLITINGPIVKNLGFNYGVGALRVGNQANTSIGRFLRLYLRNIAGFLPGRTDKGTFGGTWRVALAENDDAVASIGWEPTAVELGFKETDSLVTIRCIAATSAAIASIGDRAELLLDRIADTIAETQQGLMVILAYGKQKNFPQIIMSPCVAEVIAKGGYSRADVKQYFYEHAKVPAWRMEDLIDAEFSFTQKPSLCEFVERGEMPDQFCESTDPNRLVPIVYSPDDFAITLSGDPDRNRNLICLQNGIVGHPVTKKINLPMNWNELMTEVSGRRL